MTGHKAVGDSRLMRVDLQLIADMIEPGSRVLDIGCGDGELLYYLVREKRVDGRGLEISQRGVHGCVKRGLSVIQGDADTDLKDYPDGIFDYVILSQTLQATRNPRIILEEMLRVGRHAVVSFPNFGHWQARWYLLFRGRMPVTESLPVPWYSTPNIHLCTIRDFVLLCEECGFRILQGYTLAPRGRVRAIGRGFGFSNLFGSDAVFLLGR